MRYIVYKQPLSLDRFFLHDVPVCEAAHGKLECAFVMVNLNRFQQIVTIYTFMAQNDQTKVSIQHTVNTVLIVSIYIVWQ